MVLGQLTSIVKWLRLRSIDIRWVNSTMIDTCIQGSRLSSCIPWRTHGSHIMRNIGRHDPLIFRGKRLIQRKSNAMNNTNFQLSTKMKTLTSNYQEMRLCGPVDAILVIPLSFCGVLLKKKRAKKKGKKYSSIITGHRPLNRPK